MIKGSPSNDVVEAILRRLGTDSAFREKMIGNPKAAFAEHGVEIDESAIPAKRALPSMEEFKRNHEAYKAKLSTECGFSPFYLC
jgi:putative modified peptide